jgi:hypothetical protein
MARTQRSGNLVRGGARYASRNVQYMPAGSVFDPVAVASRRHAVVLVPNLGKLGPEMLHGDVVLLCDEF